MKSEAAENLLRATLAREPRNVGARLNLAADLLQDERAGDALALLGEAEPPADDLRAARHWHLQKSLALLQLGRAGEAKAELDALAALGPIPPKSRRSGIGGRCCWRALKTTSPRAREAAERMEASLETMGADAVLEHQIMAHYDLAKFWSGAECTVARVRALAGGPRAAQAQPAVLA